MQFHHENPKHYRRCDLRKYNLLPSEIDSKWFNENVVSKEFLELCKKAGKLFGTRKNKIFQTSVLDISVRIAYNICTESGISPPI